MTVAIVKQQRAAIIARTSPAGALQQSNAPVTLKSVVGSGVSRMDELLDVVPDAGTTPAGSTLVYDPVTDKYTVKLLDIDGGTF